MSSAEIEWQDCRAQIDDSVVAEVESLLYCDFPDDFRAIIKKCHGGIPVPNRFVYHDAVLQMVESSIEQLLSFNLEDADNIVRSYYDLSTQLPDDLIPFACDAGGDYICFDYRSDSSEYPVVVYWSHESEPDASIFYLADSFSEFLGMLK
ncbi:MAG: SMI1/KNR4 family protein [Caldilineaceae bacterium]|nr:SMI1/KNR4 family protein [Caldilineaceae bacterium]